MTYDMIILSNLNLFTIRVFRIMQKMFFLATIVKQIFWRGYVAQFSTVRGYSGCIHFTDPQSMDHHLDRVHGPPNIDHPFLTSRSTEFTYNNLNDLYLQLRSTSLQITSSHFVVDSLSSAKSRLAV